MTSLLIVTALLVVPGLGAALALAAPGRVALETRTALVIGLGYAQVAGLAIGLALAHVLSRATFIVGVIAITLAVWGVALRQASPRAHAAAIWAQIREAPFVVAAEVVVLGAVALTWPLYPPANNFTKHAPWRYWADGLEVAAAGHVSPTTDQWGAVLPTAVDKVVLDAFEGGVSFLIGEDPLRAMRALLALAALGLAAAFLGLGRELGLRAFAPLVPVIVLLLPGRLPIAREIAGDLGAYKAEDVGRVVALTALLVAIYGVVKTRSGVLTVVSGVIFALAALTHGVSAVVAVAMLSLYVLGAVIVSRIQWRRTLAMAALVLVVAVTGYLAMLRLSGGDLGFQSVTTAPRVTHFPSDIDPTRSFDRAKVVRIKRHQGHFFIQPSTIAKRYAETTVGGAGWIWGALVLGLLAAATVLIVLAEFSFLPLAVVAWGLVAMFVSGALLFSLRYQTQIPGDFGLRRLYDYAIVPVAIIVAATFEVAVPRLTARRSPRAIAALACLTAAVAVVAAVDRIPGRVAGTRAGAAAVGRVAAVVPCEARMLPNARSAGVWEATTGRRSIVEGLAPYLRPEVTNVVLPTVIGARQFFRDPQAHRDFLARQRVDYVVVLGRSVRAGTLPPFPTDEGALASLPGVQKVYDSGDVQVFSVGSSGTAMTPAPLRCPI